MSTFFSAGRQQREISRNEGKRRVGWLEPASGYGKAETPCEREFRECGNWVRQRRSCSSRTTTSNEIELYNADERRSQCALMMRNRNVLTRMNTQDPSIRKIYKMNGAEEESKAGLNGKGKKNRKTMNEESMRRNIAYFRILVVQSQSCFHFENSYFCCFSGGQYYRKVVLFSKSYTIKIRILVIALCYCNYKFRNYLII